MLETHDIHKKEWPKKPTRPLWCKVEVEFAFEKEQEGGDGDSDKPGKETHMSHTCHSCQLVVFDW